MNQMNPAVKISLIVGGSIAAAVAAVASGLAVWNSRRLRAYRAYRKTGKLIGRTAAILQSVSRAME